MEKEYALFDWNGERLRTLDAEREGSLHAIAEHHLVRIEGSEGTLMGVDEAGNETPLAHVLDVIEDRLLSSRIYALLSLKDGGAAGVGFVSKDGAFKGRFVRWDAQGNSVFDWQLVEETELQALVRTANGFAAVGYVDGRGSFDGVEWTLVFFDEAGIRVRSVSLGRAMRGGDSIAALPDGSLVVVQRVDNEGGTSNTRVTIVPPEDLL